MRLKITKTAKATNLYVIKSTYDPKTKKSSSTTVETLGTTEAICAREGVDDAIAWAKDYIDELNAAEKESSKSVLLRLKPSKRIDADVQRTYNVGYLFLSKIYHELGLDKTCTSIQNQGNFEFDLDEILSTLIYGRILNPSSKKATFEFARTLVDPPSFSQHQIYRALDVLSANSDKIQAALYKSSKKITSRNDSILYYDCTNYFFEIEEEDEDGGLRQYGVSKEHRPNPIVQMGLFMDADGMPLAFRCFPGNSNEQISMKPLEQTILDDFGHSRFVTCTDAGLSSKANKLFNTQGERAYITAVSVKKLEGYIRTWALEKTGWHLPGELGEFDLDACEEHEYARFYNSTFYKERLIKGKDGFEEKLIVTFSFKYREYLANIRERQTARAEETIKKGPGAVTRKNQNDPKRFIETRAVTAEGEIAERLVSGLDTKRIAAEAICDGFYAVATSLIDEEDISEILKVNAGRWEIEECFRIMKTEFKARPVYLSRDERIEAHFLTCFIALLIYRILEQRLGNEYTCENIVDTLRGFDFLEVKGEGYIPLYMRTDLTDELHETAGFRTDFEIVTYDRMRRILEGSRKRI